LAQKLKRILRSEKAAADYFSTVVFIFVVVVALAFIINLFSIISTKQQLDHCADQMVKQIQLAGGTNAQTDELFNFLTSRIRGATGITYTVNSTFRTPRPAGMTNAIQLGSPFYVTVQGRSTLGGFWNLNLVNINVVARGAGVSEKYWK